GYFSGPLHQQNSMRMKKLKKFSAMLLVLAVSASCEIVDNDLDKPVEDPNDATKVELKSVAAVLADIPLQDLHVAEVHEAVTSSSKNGYDEEYMMKNLFANPGSGVGESTTKGKTYDNPLKDLIVQHLSIEQLTKAGSEGMDPETFINLLTASDVQIYWPYSDNWDGETYPVITFDPEDGKDANEGYEMVINPDGSRHVRTVMVDEEMARQRPVWVINRNSDAAYTPLSAVNIQTRSYENPETKSENAGRSLVLKEFVANRNYDNWFAGASEFWIKIGSVEDFTAVTEAEMYLYNPSVTDFMLVVKRGQVGVPMLLDVLLVSNWTGQIVNSAFMITEDDGGTRTDWECTALVRVESKSYGVEMKLPLNSRDDIVWRGQLASKWLESYNGRTGHFGDVGVTFEFQEY
ncbi:MAG TPA: hypothetical protein O0W83_00905, partial [Methanocorpusculum sp.]|nr:hypothetical protein [Methanocorpusculum sp.]